jgi:hypothetical protein
VILCIRRREQKSAEAGSVRRPRWYPHAVRFAIGESVVAFAILLIPTFMPADLMAGLMNHVSLKAAHKRVAEIHGWPVLGDFLDAQTSRFGTDTPVVVVGPSYAQTSSAMYYSRNLDMAYSLDEGPGRYGQQFVFWAPRSEMPLGCDAILFEAGDPKFLRPDQEKLARCFERLEVITPEGDPRLKYWTILRGHNYKGGLEDYPRPQPRGAAPKPS